MADYDFWLEPEDTANVRISALAKRLGETLGVGYDDGEHPDLLRLAVWIDRVKMEADYSADNFADWATEEQEQFAGDYDDLADACETLHNDYNGEPDSGLVIDWEATWSYSWQYDFDAVSYTKRDETNSSDFYPMGRFAGAGTWIWRNN